MRLERVARARLLGVLAASTLLLCGGGAARAGVPGSGGVVIDGVPVPPERVWDEYRFEFGVRSIIHSKPANVVDEKILSAVTERVVNTELFAREAARRGYRLSAEEEASIRPTQVEKWHGEKSFQTFLGMVGVGEAFILERERRRLLTEKMIAGESRAEEQVTEAAVREHYGRNPKAYLDPATPPLRYIFVPPADKRLDLVAMDIRVAAAALLEEGKGYETLVSRWSRHESAAGGGVVPEGTLRTSSVFPHLPGSVGECRTSKVKIDDAGLHLYYRDCRLPLPFEAVRERAREGSVKEIRALWARDLMEKLRGTARLEYREGPYPDLGAGPKPAGHQPEKKPGIEVF